MPDADDGHVTRKTPPSGGKERRPSSLRPHDVGPCREKATRSGSNGVLDWASTEMQGWRVSMQDATCALLSLPPPYDQRGIALFGMFDGHGGSGVACLVANVFVSVLLSCVRYLKGQDGGNDDSDDWAIYEQGLAKAFPAMDMCLRNYGVDGAPKPGEHNAFQYIGSTAVIALVEWETKPPRTSRRAVVASCGDSRAVLCHEGRGIPLSTEHKPETLEERRRIEAAGGSVERVGPCHRIRYNRGGLNLSRAFGDYHYKSRGDLPPEAQQVIAVPDVCAFELHPEDFLLLSCDGVSEAFDCQETVNRVREGLAHGKSDVQVVEGLVDACCSEDPEPPWLGCDNISAMLVRVSAN